MISVLPVCCTTLDRFANIAISQSHLCFHTILPAQYILIGVLCNVSTEKTIAAKVKTLTKSSEAEVSPSTSIVSLEDEVIALRARNMAMSKTLKSIKETAEKEKKRYHDLVWYARNKSRYPNHEARKRIETDEEHSGEIEKLNTPEGDYFHGIHSGILAATRVFEKQADILHVNEKDDVGEVMSEAAKHEEKIANSLEAYPHVYPEEISH